jgi:hypothetical protein
MTEINGVARTATTRGRVRALTDSLRAAAIPQGNADDRRHDDRRYGTYYRRKNLSGKSRREKLPSRRENDDFR